ncbi:hypothetical protein RQP46_000868 [Phenoliferia psychrophenolica]
MPIINAKSHDNLAASTRRRSESLPDGLQFSPEPFSTLPRKTNPIKRLGHRLSRIFVLSPPSPDRAVTVAATPRSVSHITFPRVATDSMLGEELQSSAPRLIRTFSLSLSSLRPGGSRMISSTSVRELRTLAATLEDEGPSSAVVTRRRSEVPLGGRESLTSSTTSKATTHLSIFEATTSVPSTARSSWEDDEDAAGTPKVASRSFFSYKTGPFPLSPTIVQGSAGLVPGRSLSAIPDFGAYTLDVKGLDFVDDVGEGKDDDGLRLSSLVLLVPAALVPMTSASGGLVRRSDNTTSFTVPPISFFWDFVLDDSALAIKQCSTLQLSTTANNGSSTQPKPPFYFSTFGEGLEPEVQYASKSIGDTFQWTANLPVGTTFSLAMTDSDGNSGGARDPDTILAGSSSCTMAANSTTLSLVIDPSNNPCSEINLTPTGGKAPYTASLLAGTSGQYANATGLTGKTLHLKNAVPAGQEFWVLLTDSTGKSSKVSQAMTSGLNQAGCESPAPASSSSSDLAPIIGGVVGGVLIALILLVLGYWYFRRKQNAKAEAAHRQELNSADYRLADGTAPRITPFVLGAKDHQTDEYKMIPSSSEHSPYREDSFREDQSAYGAAPYSTHQGHPSQHSLPPISTYSNTPSSPHTNTHSGYPSFDSTLSDSPNNSEGGTDARTGLANPDAFSYRNDAATARPLRLALYSVGVVVTLLVIAGSAGRGPVPVRRLASSKILEGWRAKAGGAGGAWRELPQNEGLIDPTYVVGADGNMYPPDVYPSAMNPFKRANAALVSLVRNGEKDAMRESMRHVEERFNRKFGYPWVFMNDEPFTEDFKQGVRSMTRSECFFDVIPKEHWSYPASINQTLAAQERKKMEDENIIYGGSESYRHMCRFNSGFFFNSKSLLPFDYYWRVEPGVEFSCDIDYDPFLFMQANNKVYSFTIALYEYERTIMTLWPAVRKFAKLHPEHIAPNNALNFLVDDVSDGIDGRYNLCHFWSNFEIADLRFWRSQAYQDFFNYLDETGGFFYERWGDAPVHSIAAALFAPADQIHQFNDIAYRHNPYTHCPQNPSLFESGKCNCNPKESFDMDGYSCMKQWWKVGKNPN